MKLKTACLIILLLAVSLAGCTSLRASAVQTRPGFEEELELNVFAAASLTEPFTEIGALFEATHPGLTVAINLAGSQQLAQQIIAGAPADVFASANPDQMRVAIQAGVVVSGAQQVFARNRLVVIFPKDNPAGLRDLSDLANPDLKLVFADQEVPVGRYSQDFLEQAVADLAFGPGYKDGVLSNVVSFEDNVKGVLAKVALGEADAGIVYASDISAADAGKVGRIDIPDELNVIAAYPIAPLVDANNPHLAREFIDFVLSEAGQAVLAKFSFVPVVGF